MVKILYTTPEIMHPPVNGPFLRVENSIKALNKITELHIISRRPINNIGGIEAEKFYSSLCKKFIYSPSVEFDEKNILSKIKRFFMPKIISDADFIIKYVKKNKINIIWFGYGNISYDLMKKIKEKEPNLKLVCDTDSVWSRFISRGLPYAKNANEKQKIISDTSEKEFEEKSWCDFCDAITAVSQIDADYYKSITKKIDKIKIFSNVIDLDTYKEKLLPPVNFKSPNIYLAGSYWREGCPMEIAARWVINDIFPIIKKNIPNIHFYIVGLNSDIFLKDVKDANITITGRLDSVLSYLYNANVAIVPLKFESGTRFKILEAAACGIPIVSTVLGAEGIPIENGKNILIADEANDFANAVIKIIKDREFAKNIADNLRKYVSKNYSIEKHSKEAEEIINYLQK